jgi:sugar/nucleoside kinase (ribokinase family)
MEITIFNRKGRAVAYIADDGEDSIYTWDGHAVAYVDDEVVHGWNGRHLGWLIVNVRANTRLTG